VEFGVNLVSYEKYWYFFIWKQLYDKRQKPIAADPYGAVTNLGTAYRNPKDKTDFFTLFDKFATGEEIEVNDKHFVMGKLTPISVAEISKIALWSLV
jgi:hypothetical protein